MVVDGDLTLFQIYNTTKDFGIKDAVIHFSAKITNKVSSDPEIIRGIEITKKALGKLTKV